MKKMFWVLPLMFILVPLLAEAKKTVSKLEAGETASSKLTPSIYFEDNSDVITDSAAIENNARWLKSHPDKVVVLSGHCDERGTNEYNLNLGDRRARSVMKALMDKGVSEKQLILMSYGKNKPKILAHSRQGWSQNRRVDFVIR